MVIILSKYAGVKPLILSFSDHQVVSGRVAATKQHRSNIFHLCQVNISFIASAPVIKNSSCSGTDSEKL